MLYVLRKASSRIGNLNANQYLEVELEILKDVKLDRDYGLVGLGQL